MSNEHEVVPGLGIEVNADGLIEQLVNNENFEKNFKEFFEKDETFKVCIILQDKFNCSLLGDNWKQGENKTDWPVDFPMATLAEMGECVESTKYGWWKTFRSEDTENIITEIIDAFHFELSKILETYPEDNGLINAILCSSWIHGDLTLTNEEILELSDHDRQLAMNQLIKKFTFFSIMIEEFMPKNIIEYYLACFTSLFDLFKFFSIEKEEVVKRYLVKNALNKVRKINGYKEGLYSKQWVDIDNGEIKEDNVIALRITSALENDFDLILTVLDTYYLTNVKDKNISK